jgi:hypothetical protein
MASSKFRATNCEIGILPKTVLCVSGSLAFLACGQGAGDTSSHIGSSSHDSINQAPQPQQPPNGSTTSTVGTIFDDGTTTTILTSNGSIIQIGDNNLDLQIDGVDATGATQTFFASCGDAFCGSLGLEPSWQQWDLSSTQCTTGTAFGALYPALIEAYQTAQNAATQGSASSSLATQIGVFGQLMEAMAAGGDAPDFSYQPLMAQMPPTGLAPIHPKGPPVPMSGPRRPPVSIKSCGGEPAIIKFPGDWKPPAAPDGCTEAAATNSVSLNQQAPSIKLGVPAYVGVTFNAGSSQGTTKCCPGYTTANSIYQPVLSAVDTTCTMSDNSTWVGERFTGAAVAETKNASGACFPDGKTDTVTGSDLTVTIGGVDVVDVRGNSVNGDFKNYLAMGVAAGKVACYKTKDVDGQTIVDGQPVKIGWASTVRELQ